MQNVEKCYIIERVRDISTDKSIIYCQCGIDGSWSNIKQCKKYKSCRK